jgi:hypothetical protein
LTVVRAKRAVHRVLSGWLLALSSAALSIAGHGAAGGGVPDTASTAVLTVLVAWAGTALADRMRGIPATLAVLATVQLGMHLLLSEVATHATHLPAPGAVNGWLMLLGHGAALGVTAVLLTRATEALVAVAGARDWLYRQLAALWYPADTAPAATVVISTVPARPGHLLEVQLRRVRSRRGPPDCS